MSTILEMQIDELQEELDVIKAINQKLQLEKNALKEQLVLYGVVSSAWYCKISNQNGQWFEIVTGKNEMDVVVKIIEKFGKQTVYNLIDRYELM